jgi:hypothetical protein
MKFRYRSASLLAAPLALAVTAGLTLAAPPVHAAGSLPTTTTLSASPSTTTAGTPVALKATIKVVSLDGLASGTVAFKATNGGPAVTLGTAPVGSCTPVLMQCTASLTTTALPTGTDVVTGTYSGDDVSAGSSGKTTVVVAPPPPQAPTGPTLVATAQVGSIKLDWSSASDGGSPITSYRLYRSSVAGGPYALIASEPTGDYQDTTVVIGTTYYYRATTVNALGESPYSNTASAAAMPYTGSQTYATTQCSAGSACSTPTVSGTGASGNPTTVSMQLTSSAGPHTATVAAGGPGLRQCTLPGAGLPASFNDTSTDASKTVIWKVVAGDADIVHAAFSKKGTRYFGCLGLGTPWVTGDGRAAVWDPEDGLYEGTPALCDYNTAYANGDGTFSAPCTKVRDSSGSSAHTFEIDYLLPPGDGRISGGP